MTPLIRALRYELRSLQKQTWPSYTVPGLWVGNVAPVTFPNAASYLLHQLQVIDQEERARRHRKWCLRKALAYNGMVRHITSYDHGAGTQESGWQTKGTFLKLAALLPYLVRMDVDTLVLLPITEIGETGKKGTLGSVYAVKHPWHLDPNLTEPNVPLPLEDQARIMVEACHALGIRVIVETVLRTASTDSAIVPTHPEWFYWIDEEKLVQQGGGFHAPSFTTDELTVIENKVANHDYNGLPEPPASFRELFTSPPIRTESDDQGWKGIASKQRIVRIPGAFADWPPNDEQPAWKDVTYYRLHDHPQYRYMAYNTVRMYERALDSEDYRSQPLWNTIASFIPFYIRMLNTDGAMIDMGHALPDELRRMVMREARATNADFVLLEENFDDGCSQTSTEYDAAIGNLPLIATSVEQLRECIRHRASTGVHRLIFGTPESHNTPRALSKWGTDEAVAAVWTVLRVLPGTIGFVHSGIELLETTPVNTGLGYTANEAAEYPAERLPLFSDVPMNWDAPSAVLSAIARTSHILNGSGFWEIAAENDALIVLDTPPECIAFLRIPHDGRQGLLCVANLSNTSVRTRLSIPPDSGVMFLAPNPRVKRAGSNIDVEMLAWTVELVFTLH